jgi:hypothetical protein
MKKILKLLCILLFFLPCLSLWATDVGLIFDQNAGYGGLGDDGNFDYTGMLVPRVSSYLGNSGGIYFSAGFKFDYIEQFTFVPELLRTEFFWRFDNGEFRAGRIQYSDPLGFIAEGLFDGVVGSIDTAAGTFGIGAWYAGFLYKKRTTIAMTPGEEELNNLPLDYGNFSDTYFAPVRLISALDWEHQSLGGIAGLRLSVLGQFDLRSESAINLLGPGVRVHSQYFSGKLTVPFRDFVFDLGGCLELTEQSDEMGVAFAGQLGAAWMPPASFESRLSLLGHFTSGNTDGSVAAFLPVTTKNQGEILKAKLSGLSVISLEYTARLHKTFSGSVSSSYFIRSDLGTYTMYGNEGWFLGNEFFGRLLWAPLSDVQLSLGAGAFLFSLGNSSPDTPVLWRVEMGIILSLY